MMKLSSLVAAIICGALSAFADGAIVTTRRADGSSNNLRASSVVDVVDIEVSQSQSSHSTYEAYPLFSQHLYKIMQSSSSGEQSLIDQLQNAVFSYELNGQAKKRMRSLQDVETTEDAVEDWSVAQEEKSSKPIAEYGMASEASRAGGSRGDGHGDDGHEDAHSMVVHVTYEDICE